MNILAGDPHTLLECCEVNLIGDSAVKLKDKNVDSSVAGKAQAQEVSVGKYDSISS